ncbi:MAG: hypothetical protein JXQ65_12820 [Candidatus Marinimicrobia bacterium]|nr:hypothetical protein [Candidatus Neomarinimicrobiota bacterium]
MRKTDFSYYSRVKRYTFEQMARVYREETQQKDIPWTPFENKLIESKIALITVSGAFETNDEPFVDKDKKENYGPKEISIKAKSEDLHYLALDWDPSEALKDANVIFPAEHLVLMQKEGIIGKLNDVAYSFTGLHEKKSTLQESVKSVIKSLKDNENQGVLIIPVSPMTAEASCKIAKQIEKAGISTVLLTPFYEQALVYSPPRCAFVNFPFGRVLGPAKNITLQTAILRELLKLFEKLKIPGEILNLNFIWSFGEIE